MGFGKFRKNFYTKQKKKWALKLKRIVRRKVEVGLRKN